MENRYIEAYLSSQLKTFVAIVISVVHLVVPLSQDNSPHHHSQVNTLSPEVKLFDLQTNIQLLYWLVILRMIHDPPSVFTYRHMGEDERGQQLSSFLHLGLFGSSPHPLSPDFIPEIPESLRHRAAVSSREQ